METGCSISSQIWRVEVGTRPSGGSKKDRAEQGGAGQADEVKIKRVGVKSDADFQA